MIFRALTISQPFASMIADGEKRIENRWWSTDYRGPLAIHAGKGTQYLTRHDLRRFPTGCVLAIARLAGCVHLDYARQEYAARHVPYCLSRDGFGARDLAEILDDVHAEGPVLWILRDVRRFPRPIPARGAQRLWGWRAPDNWREMLDGTEATPRIKRADAAGRIDSGGGR